MNMVNALHSAMSNMLMNVAFLRPLANINVKKKTKPAATSLDPAPFSGVLKCWVLKRDEASGLAGFDSHLPSSNTSYPHQAEAINVHQAESWKGINSLLQFKLDGCIVDFVFVICKRSWLERD